MEGPRHRAPQPGALRTDAGAGRSRTPRRPASPPRRRSICRPCRSRAAACATPAHRSAMSRCEVRVYDAAQWLTEVRHPAWAADGLAGAGRSRCRRRPADLQAREGRRAGRCRRLAAVAGAACTARFAPAWSGSTTSGRGCSTTTASRLEVEASPLVGQAGVTWGWRRTSASTVEMRTEGALDLLALSIELRLVRRARRRSGARSRIRIHCKGRSELRMTIAQLGEQGQEGQDLKSVLRTWRFPFTLEIEPLAGAEPATLSAAAGADADHRRAGRRVRPAAARRRRRACSGSSPCALEPVTIVSEIVRPDARQRARARARSSRRCRWSTGARAEPASADMAMERLLMLELAAGGCAVEVQLNGMPLAALGAGGRQHQPGGPRVHAGRAQRADARRRPAAPGATRAEPASRRDRSHLGAGAPGARAPGPVAGRSRCPRPRRRRVGDDRRPLLRRAVGAQARGRSSGQLPALALARRAAGRARRCGAAGHSRVPAAARGRARPRQSRAADRRRRSCASTSWRSPIRTTPTPRCSASATMCSGCMLRKH